MCGFATRSGVRFCFGKNIFMIIFGWSTKPRVIEHKTQIKCSRCGIKTTHDLIRISKTFNLYFVPIIPLSIQYYARCRLCGSEQNISSERKNILIQESKAKHEIISQEAAKKNADLLNKYRDQITKEK